jgi:predicted AlkP superfamily phosphohydrolase/phosphomutase
MLWDAAAADMAERFLREGALPSLARLVSSGTLFAARPSWPCAQTPPGMATLITGAPTAVHGIYGFREAARPRTQRNALETESGFDARRLRAEPLWTTAARAGRSVTVVFAPFASPQEAYLPGGVWGPRSAGDREILTFDGYGAVLAGQAVHRGSDLVPSAPPAPPPGTPELVESRGLRLALPLGSVAGEPPRASPEPATATYPHGQGLGGELWLGVGRRRGSERFDTAWVRAAGAHVSQELPPGKGSPVGVRLAPSVGVVLCLFELAPDGRDLLLWRGGIWRLRGTSGAAVEEASLAMGPFLGAGAGHAYREGALGPTCRDGGSGEAESRYLAALAASSATFARASVHALERSAAEVTFLYEPCIDETAHLVQDLAEAGLRGEGGPAARGLFVLREAYRLADAHLGRVLDALEGDGTVVAVASDHGQQAVKRIFRPNVVLKDAGLLGCDIAGRVDLSRTKAVYGFAANGYLLVNADDHPHGIVPRSEVEDVAREAARILLAWRDRDGSAPVERTLFPNESDARGRVPGAEAGDACILAAPGIALGVGCCGEACEPAHGGQHTSAQDAPELDALFAVGGPGVPARGRAPDRVDNLDVAPTLARLVGLPAPRDSIGRALLG